MALEEEVAESAARSAKRQGTSLSAWLTRAAANALRIEDGLAAVREFEAENGPFSEEEIRKADAILRSSGVKRRSRKS